MAEYYLKVLLIMVVLFVFILPGYILRKLKMLSTDVLPSLSNILLYVCQPMMFFKAICINPIEATSTVLLNMLYVFLLSFAGMMAVFFLTRLLFRNSKDRKRTDVYSFMAVFSNCGFIGLPFVDLLTDGNSEAMLYAITFNIAFNFLIWTLGLYLMTQKTKAISFKNAFLNPSVISVAISMVLFTVPALNIFDKPVLAPLQQIVIYLGEMTAPLSMIIVGVRAAEIPLKEIFCTPSDYIAALLRLVVAPAIMILLVLPFRLTGAFGPEAFTYYAPIIAMAMTPASTAVAYAEKFNGDKRTAVRSFISGTVLGIVTIPLIITLITLL